MGLVWLEDFTHRYGACTTGRTERGTRSKRTRTGSQDGRRKGVLLERASTEHEMAARPSAVATCRSARAGFAFGKGKRKTRMHAMVLTFHCAAFRRRGVD